MSVKNTDPLRKFVWWVLGIDFVVSLGMAIASAIYAHQAAVLLGTPSGQAWLAAIPLALWNFVIFFIVAGVFIAIIGVAGIFLLSWLLGVKPKTPPKK